MIFNKQESNKTQMISQDIQKYKLPRKIEVITISNNSELVDCYNAYDIPKFYQNLVFNHINKIPHQLQDQFVKEQIESISNNNSNIQNYTRKKIEKNNIENFLRLIFKTKIQKKGHKQNIQNICDHLNRLRKVNYKMAYYMCKIKEKYEVKNNKIIQKHIYCEFANSLNGFTNEMVRSQITNYIEWQQYYDPFLIYIKLKINKQSQQARQVLLKMINFTIEESSNLLKMHKVTENWICPQHNHKEHIISQKMIFPELYSYRNNYKQSTKSDKMIVKNQSEAQSRQQSQKSQSLIIRFPQEQFIQYHIPTVDMNKTKYNSKNNKFVNKSNRKKKQRIIKSIQQRYQQQQEKQSDHEFQGQPIMKNSQFTGRIKRRQRILTQPSDNIYRFPDDKSTYRSISIQNRGGLSHRNPQRRLNLLSPINQKADTLMDRNQCSYIISKRHAPKIEKNLINIQIIPFKIPDMTKIQKVTQENKQQQKSLQNKDQLQIQQTANFKKEEKKQIKTFDKQVKEVGINVSIPTDTEAAFIEPRKQIKQLSNSSNNYIKQHVNNIQKNSQNINTQECQKKNSQEQNKPMINQQTQYVKSDIKANYEVINREASYQIQENEQSEISIHTSNKALNNQQKNIQNNDEKEDKKQQKEQDILKSNISVQIPITHKSMKNSKVNSYQSLISNDKYKEQQQPSKSAVRQLQQKQDNKNKQPQVGKKLEENQLKNDKQQYHQSVQNKLEENIQQKKAQPLEQRNQQINCKKDQQYSNYQQPIQKNENKTNKKISNQDDLKIKVSQDKKYDDKKIIPSQLPKSIKNSNKYSNSANQRDNSKQFIKPESKLSNNKVQQVKQTKTQIKMKVVRHDLNDFKQYLRVFPIHPQYSQNFDVEKAIVQTHYQQSYVCQFIINSQPAVIVISSLTQNNNFVIRFWALSKFSEIKIASAIFQKYLNFVQKYVTNSQLYFRGPELAQVKNGDFQQLKANIFIKKRKTKPRNIQSQFQQNLCIMCSQIAIVQNDKISHFTSSEIEAFGIHNSKINPKFFLMASEAIPEALRDIVSLHNNIPSLKAANKILKDQGFDVYTTSSKVQLKGIDLCTLNILSEFKELFIACNGHFKFLGNVVLKNQQKLIYSIKLSKYNGRLLFAKGYKNCAQVTKSLTVDTSQKIEFVVPMFEKLLYGQYKQKSSDKMLYASWDISLFWEDQIQGAVQHSFQGYQKFGEDKFHVAVQIEGYLCYVFSVEKHDFLQ